jgi:hypothetical protein
MTTADWPRYIADPMTSQARREDDLAVIARIGGNVFRHDAGMVRARGYTREQTDEYMASEVQHKVNDRKASRRAQLPEAAFDWPVYRAAMLRTVIEGLVNDETPLPVFEGGSVWRAAQDIGNALNLWPEAIPESELRALAGDR